MQTAPSQARTHPLILTAAIAVTAVALAGVGVLTGILPNPAAAPKPEMSATQTQESSAEKTAEPVDPIKIAEPEETAKHVQAASSAPAKKHVAHKAKAAVSPAPTSSSAHASNAPSPPPKCNDCGVVEQIRTLTVEPDGSGVGGVAGGVVGGLLGNQIGQGRGRTVATVAGVVGGALAGNKIEKTMKKKQTYETVVRYEDGTTQVFPSDAPPGWREGDKVRVDNGAIVSR